MIKLDPIKHYPSVNVCIYCGDDSSPLTDEHIVPSGLGGTLLLDQASCKKCQETINIFETKCLREMLDGTRRSLGLKGLRNKKEKLRPADVVIVSPDLKHLDLIGVPTFDAPRSCMLMPFGVPGILIGEPPIERFTPNKMWIHNPDERRAVQRFGGAGYRLGAFHPILFGRMLAKIAHAFAVAGQGISSFEPLLLDLILGKSNLLSYLVGGDLEPPPVFDALHRLHLYCRLPEKPEFGNHLLLVVDVRLFAFLGAPQYRVVVGRWKRGAY